MKWMEFIKVQTTDADTEEKLRTLISEHGHCHGLQHAKVFHNAYVDDCSILLVWDTEVYEMQGSSIGQYLKSSLKQYGLVDYSIWIEKGKKEERTS